MKIVIKKLGLTIVVMAVGLLMAGCYTQVGSVRDEYSPYNENVSDDTTGTPTYSHDRYGGYDDNFYGYDSFSRYRFFSFYYPTYYWNWSYDPWYDYGWYDPWYSPYYGGWGGYYSYYHNPWYWGGNSIGYYHSSSSNDRRSPFGQGRGRISDTSPFGGGRDAGRTGFQTTPTVNLPSAAGVNNTGTNGASVRQQPANKPGAAQQPRQASVRKSSSNTGRSRNGNATGQGNSGRSRTEGRQYTPPPSPPSHDSGTRSSGGSSGGDRGGGGTRSGGGDRSGGGRGR
ncbi:MAG: hypothetical protein ABSB78_07960 [Bacteroidota bacterium]